MSDHDPYSDSERRVLTRSTIFIPLELRESPTSFDSVAGHFTVRVCSRELSLETEVEKRRKRAASGPTRH